MCSVVSKLHRACQSDYGLLARFATSSWQESLAVVEVTGQLIKVPDGQVTEIVAYDYYTVTNWISYSRGLRLDFCHLLRIQLVNMSTQKLEEHKTYFLYLLTGGPALGLVRFYVFVHEKPSAYFLRNQIST
jgi:hypothetical protein